MTDPIPYVCDVTAAFNSSQNLADSPKTPLSEVEARTTDLKTKMQTASTGFNDLLKELTNIIFTYYPDQFYPQQFALVSKRWNDVLRKTTFPKLLTNLESHLGEKRVHLIFNPNAALTPQEKVRLIFQSQEDALSFLLGSKELVKPLIAHLDARAISFENFVLVEKWIKQFNLFLICQRVEDPVICAKAKALIAGVKEKNFVIEESFKELQDLLKERPPQQTTLKLDYSRLTELPPEIQYFKKLTALDLEGNRLEKLPEAMGCLTQLVSLVLSTNRLVEMPSAFNQLSSLHTVNMSHNNLTRLPSVEHLNSLEKIVLKGNPLVELPSGLLLLPRLREIQMSAYQIQHLQFKNVADKLSVQGKIK